MLKIKDDFLSVSRIKKEKKKRSFKQKKYKILNVLQKISLQLYIPVIMKVIINYTTIILLWIGCSNGIALAPSTFGGVVASAGRLTNSIRVSYNIYF